MNQESSKTLKSFTDLLAWQKAHQLVLEIYRITRDFPPEELYGLTSQLKRAAVSITSNIAEGFSRGSYKEKIQFYLRALGSSTEVQNQPLVARDVKYLSQENFTRLAQLSVEVNKLINGLIKKSKTFIHDS